MAKDKTGAPLEVFPFTKCHKRELKKGELMSCIEIEK